MSQERDTFDAVTPELHPPGLSAELRDQVLREIQPSVARVLGRATFAHAIAGSASLLVCPQFGIGPWGGHSGLMAWLMPLGWWACAIGCGMAFMTGTGMACAALLSPDERRVLVRHQGWIFSLLSMVSWMVLMLLPRDPHFDHLTGLDYTGAWLAAAALAAMASLRLQRSVTHSNS